MVVLPSRRALACAAAMLMFGLASAAPRPNIILFVVSSGRGCGQRTLRSSASTLPPRTQTTLGGCALSTPRPLPFSLLPPPQTDDQDTEMNSLAHMPIVKKELIDAGATFTRMYATVPVCCPSRSSLYSGQYSHNNGCRGNAIETNCSSPAWQRGPETRSFAAHLAAAGYQTSFAGKVRCGAGVAIGARVRRRVSLRPDSPLAPSLVFERLRPPRCGGRGAHPRGVDQLARPRGQLRVCVCVAAAGLTRCAAMPSLLGVGWL